MSSSVHSDSGIGGSGDSKKVQSLVGAEIGCCVAFDIRLAVT
jgi:hypothetical protein